MALLKTLPPEPEDSQVYHPVRLDLLPDHPRFIDAIRANFRMMDNLPLPIGGGWGYGKDDAVIVDLSLDEGYEEGRPFNLDRLARLVIESRIFLACVMRPSDRLAGIEWKVQSCDCIEDGGRQFEKYTVSVHGCPEWVWDALGHDWRKTRNRTPRSKAEAHEFIRTWFDRMYEAEYWFDITRCPEESKPMGKEDNQ